MQRIKIWADVPIGLLEGLAKIILHVIRGIPITDEIVISGIQFSCTNSGEPLIEIEGPETLFTAIQKRLRFLNTEVRVQHITT